MQTGPGAAEPDIEQLHAVLVAARGYIAAVKASEKGGVGRAWGALVKAVNACDGAQPVDPESEPAAAAQP